MKKNLFILAAALAVCYSCSNDETVEVNQGEAISFRPLTNGVTRAVEKTSFAANDVINVWADYGSNAYFTNVNFTKDGEGGFKSAVNQTYYWPAGISSSNKVTFYATYGATQSAKGQIASATYDGEEDVLFAKTEVSTKPDGGVSTMNFRHALSEIDVKAKNTNSGLEVTITGVRVGYVAKTASFSCSAITDDNIASALTSSEPSVLDQSCWTLTNPSSPSTDVYERSSGISKTLTGVVSAAQVIGDFKPWMLIPQNLSYGQSAPSMVYSKAYKTNTPNGTGASEANLNCAYIALKMTIKNNDTGKTPIVAEQWCYWPITESWLPGKKYTYIVDVAGGGYQPTNVDSEESTDLDEVLRGLAIQFNACSIDVWVTDLNNNNTADDDINVVM